MGILELSTMVAAWHSLSKREFMRVTSVLTWIGSEVPSVGGVSCGRLVRSVAEMLVMRNHYFMVRRVRLPIWDFLDGVSRARADSWEAKCLIQMQLLQALTC